MPLKGFICPDGKTVDIDSELIQCVKCRLGDRCFSLTYLRVAASDRIWKGKPSTTMLLPENGLRYIWLKIKYPYYIKPEDKAFSILGTWSHDKLDRWAKKLGITSEFIFKNQEITGILDRLEPSPIDDTFWLYDNKTWGSFSIGKADNGEKENSIYQLNNYRIKAENSLELSELMKTKIKISRMFIEVIIRDGGISKQDFSTKKYSYIPRTKRIEIPIWEDNKIIDYFKARSEALLNYIDKDIIPPVCSNVENWNWKRCKKFCEPYQHCPEGQKINFKGR